MTKGLNDGVWRKQFSLPSGSFNYFAALNGTFDQTYGLHGGNALTPVPLSVSTAQLVKFYFDENTHWITDNVNSQILVLAGSFQSELGCTGDFQANCLRSWLEDVDGDGIYTFETLLPVGNYGTIVAANEGFDLTYHNPDGGNYDFTAIGNPVKFSFNGLTHILTIDNGATQVAVPETGTWSMMLIGFFVVGFIMRRQRQQRNVSFTFC
jgi:hypothetical protein